MKRILILIFAILLISVYVSHCIAQDLKYKAQLMCNRRDVKFKKIESVAFPMRLEFGLPDGTALLPAIPNGFYYCEALHFYNLTTVTTGAPQLELTNLNPNGSAGDIRIANFSLVANNSMDYSIPFEFNSMLFRVNGMTAGTVIVLGTVYKITYE